MSALVEILSGLGDKGPAAIVVEARANACCWMRAAHCIPVRRSPGRRGSR